MAVFVLDQHQKPLMPCSEKRARLLLARGRARVHRLIPFTIRVIDRRVAESQLQPLELKIDPGSKMSGLALVRNSESVNTETGEITATAHVLNLFELIHRGFQISHALTARRQMRRRRSARYAMPLEPREALIFNPQRVWFKALATASAPLFNVAMATVTQPE